MNITKYIPAVHDWYVAQGEYKCKTCSGNGGWIGVNIHGEQEADCCDCNGTGKHKNIGELLAEIAGLLVGDALRAYRENRHPDFGIFDWDRYAREDIPLATKYHAFSIFMQNTFEDYLVQVFIKLFDLCGYREIKLDFYPFGHQVKESKNVPCLLYRISRLLPDDSGDIEEKISKFFSVMIVFCQIKEIPIEKHIWCRLQYMGVEV